MNKKVWIVVLVLILAIAAGVWLGQTKKSATPGSGQTSGNPTPQTGPSPAPQAATPAPAPSPTVKVSPPPKLDYGTAISTYNFRIQFSQCHGNPGTMNVSKGTPVMLDNRDNVAHTIKADNQTFRIAALDYVVFASSAIGTFNTLCDGGGAGTLTVQK